MESQNFFLLLQRTFEGEIYYDLMSVGGYCSMLQTDYKNLVRFYGQDRVLLLPESEYFEFSRTHDVMECQY